MGSGPENELTCPFCGESDFDKIGLKHHLQYYCDVFEAVDELPHLDNINYVFGLEME